MTVDLVPSLGDELEMLVEASVRAMDSGWPMSTVRSRADGGEHDTERYRSVAADLGWFGFLADEAHGGGSVSGNGVLDAAVIAAERGARLQPGPFVGHHVVVHALSTTADPVHDEVLTELVEGRTWATWAFGAEAHCELRATAEGSRLFGAIDVLAEMGDGGWVLVPVDSPSGTLQVLVALDAPGVSLRPLEGFDVSRRWFAVDLDGVEIGRDRVVGGPGAATDDALVAQTRLAAVLTAAESVGAMHADLDAAVRYAKDRVAFGRPIGSFQAVKHLLADTSLWAEMSKALVATAATEVGTGGPEAAEHAHAAKAFVAERGAELTQNCFQVFAGIGYTWEHDQHLYLRRVAADAASFGDAPWHRERLLATVGTNR